VPRLSIQLISEANRLTGVPGAKPELLGEYIRRMPAGRRDGISVVSQPTSRAIDIDANLASALTLPGFSSDGFASVLTHLASLREFLPGHAASSRKNRMSFHARQPNGRRLSAPAARQTREDESTAGVSGGLSSQSRRRPIPNRARYLGFPCVISTDTIFVEVRING
jgi:hypothetical protein